MPNAEASGSGSPESSWEFPSRPGSPNSPVPVSSSPPESADGERLRLLSRSSHAGARCLRDAPPECTDDGGSRTASGCCGLDTGFVDGTLEAELDALAASHREQTPLERLGVDPILIGRDQSRQAGRAKEPCRPGELGHSCQAGGSASAEASGGAERLSSCNTVLLEAQASQGRQPCGVHDMQSNGVPSNHAGAASGIPRVAVRTHPHDSCSFSAAVPPRAHATVAAVFRHSAAVCAALGRAAARLAAQEPGVHEAGHVALVLERCLEEEAGLGGNSVLESLLAAPMLSAFLHSFHTEVQRCQVAGEEGPRGAKAQAEAQAEAEGLRGSEDKEHRETWREHRTARGPGVGVQPGSQAGASKGREARSPPAHKGHEGHSEHDAWRLRRHREESSSSSSKTGAVASGQHRGRSVGSTLKATARSTVASAGGAASSLGEVLLLASPVVGPALGPVLAGMESTDPTATTTGHRPTDGDREGTGEEECVPGPGRGEGEGEGEGDQVWAEEDGEVRVERLGRRKNRASTWHGPPSPEEGRPVEEWEEGSGSLELEMAALVLHGNAADLSRVGHRGHTGGHQRHVAHVGLPPVAAAGHAGGHHGRTLRGHGAHGGLPPVAAAGLVLAARAVGAMEQHNQLLVASLGQGERTRALQERQLAASAESIEVMRAGVALGREKAEGKKREREERKGRSKVEEFRKQMADELLFGLLVMLLGMLHSGWSTARTRLEAGASACLALHQDEFVMTWFSAYRLDKVALKSLYFLGCKLSVGMQLLTAVGILGAVCYMILLTNMINGSDSSRPASMIVLMLAAVCGYCGFQAVRFAGGVPLLWVLLWECLCLAHGLTAFYTPEVFAALYGRSPGQEPKQESGEEKGPYADDESKERLSLGALRESVRPVPGRMKEGPLVRRTHWLLPCCFHVGVALLLPLALAYLPFVDWAYVWGYLQQIAFLVAARDVLDEL